MVETIYTIIVGGEVRVTLGGIERQHLSESVAIVATLYILRQVFQEYESAYIIITKGFRQACTASPIYNIKRLIHAGVNGLNSWHLNSHYGSVPASGIKE